MEEPWTHGSCGARCKSLSARQDATPDFTVAFFTSAQSDSFIVIGQEVSLIHP